MADERARNLERAAAQGDVDAGTKLLLERMRAGELTQGHVELAAILGHSLARVLYPEVERVDWSLEEPQLDAILRGAELLDKTLPARVAADWAERALPRWETLYSDDTRLHEAIAAARVFARCPCQQHCLAAAEKVAQTCPSIASIRVYEIMSM